VDEVKRNVKALAENGVIYITLAHLFWRQVATNAPAVPFIPDPVYKLIFCQPRVGLTKRGEAAVEAMYRHRVLVDVSHMRQDALDKTFARLNQLDNEHHADPKDFPIIASHAGFRCGRQSYNLSRDTVSSIAERDGVIGLILAQHQLNDGIIRFRKTKDLDESMRVICRHIKAIHEVTGTYDNIAIGSDLDGFIKPTMTGLDYASDLGKLRDPLEEFFPGQSERILSGNALRVVRKALAARATA
jgi:microsomal dipeptidase-like Zn-dependent dipeptidase